MSGQKLIIGNWKMHFSVKQAVSFASKLAAKTVPEGVVVAVAPHNLSLCEIATMLQKTPIKIVAQNAYAKDEGAFTGEISMPMLRGFASYVIIGHSERRHIFYEQQPLIREKVASAVRSNITPILCIGETLIERQHYHTNSVISEQLTTGLADLTAEDVSKLVIAYEPVWAIGTGELAMPSDVEKAVLKIRREIASLYGGTASQNVTILYGGSVTKESAASYLQIEGVNGLLVGGASLSVSTFWPIVQQAKPGSVSKISVIQQGENGARKK